MKVSERGMLEQLVGAGGDLSGNRDLVRGNYGRLMMVLNDQLKGIRIVAPTLYYTVCEWNERGYYGTLRRHEARLALHLGEEGAYLELEERWKGEDRWYTNTLVHPSLEVMWAVGVGLGGALEYFLDEIRCGGRCYRKAFRVFTRISRRLGAGV